MSKKKVMIDIVSVEKLKEAKEAIGFAMADALLGKQHKDEERRKLRTEQLEGLEFAVDLINRAIKEEERIQAAIDAPVDIDSY
jgi:hypothetical protein